MEQGPQAGVSTSVYGCVLGKVFMNVVKQSRGRLGDSVTRWRGRGLRWLGEPMHLSEHQGSAVTQTVLLLRRYLLNKTGRLARTSLGIFPGHQDGLPLPEESKPSVGTLGTASAGSQQHRTLPHNGPPKRGLDHCLVNTLAALP